MNILFPHINTSKCRFALSAALNAKSRPSNKQLFASRAQGGEGITVLSAEVQLLPQLDTTGCNQEPREEQQGTNVVLESR